MLGAKGYVKLWISVDEHGRLSWRVSPGMPEKNSVSLKYYSVREGPGQTDFRLVLKDDSPQNLRKEVLMKSMSVGDRHRWVAGLRSWCKESKKKDEDFWWPRRRKARASTGVRCVICYGLRLCPGYL